jgi:suppressor for copper-sensitivity B
LALALAAALARAAGAAVGWGVQFQRPGFVAFLAVVVVLFCLNLWGLFEIQLPWRLAQLGGGFGAGGSREGAAGHFVSGLFATLMATPCSAPFLGPAVGFALAQETAVIFAMFTAVGLGMALPYLAIAAAPGVARFLPRPGPWMETVRGFMGFLLAGAAVWLFYVLAAQVSPQRVAGIKLALLGLALFTWLRQRGWSGPRFRYAAAAGMIASVGIAFLLATGTSASATSAGAGKPAGPVAGLIAWEPFDRARAESLAAAGRLVFVDVTAEWCFTCKFNERLVLETPEVAGAFAAHGVVAMKADWTNRDDKITQFLAEHGRYGIPFYLLYRPGAEPHVFSELLTKETVVATVQEAGPEQVARR